MIQQLRLNLVSLILTTRASQNLPPASDFAEWMADDSRDAQDQTLLAQDLAVPTPMPAAPRIEPGSNSPLAVDAEIATPVSVPDYVSTPIEAGVDVATDHFQKPLPHWAQTGSSGDAATLSTTEMPSETWQPSPLQERVQTPTELRVTGKTPADLLLPAPPIPAVRHDSAAAPIKPAHPDRQPSEQDKIASLQTTALQIEPPPDRSVQRLDGTVARPEPQVAALLSPLISKPADLSPPRQRHPEAKPAPLAASTLVTVHLSDTTSQDASQTLLPQPEITAPMPQSLAISPAPDQPEPDALAPQLDVPLPVALPRSPDAQPEQPRLSLAAPANLHGQLLQHAPAAIERQVEVLLTPEELGSVKFQIRHHGDAISVLLSAERGDTMEMLRRHGDELMREFRQAGFSGATLEFGRWGQQQQSQHQTPANFALPDEFGAPPPLPRPTPPVQPLEAAQGLNLRL